MVGSGEGKWVRPANSLASVSPCQVRVTPPSSETGESPVKTSVGQAAKVLGHPYSYYQSFPKRLREFWGLSLPWLRHYVTSFHTDHTSAQGGHLTPTLIRQVHLHVHSWRASASVTTNSSSYHHTTGSSTTNGCRLPLLCGLGCPYRTSGREARQVQGWNGRGLAVLSGKLAARSRNLTSLLKRQVLGGGGGRRLWRRKVYERKRPLDGVPLWASQPSQAPRFISDAADTTE